MAMASQVSPELGFGTKFWFGVGQAAEGMKNGAFNTFLMLFYNQVLGLNPALAGAAAMLSLVSDAITDPMAGSISDSWRGSWGRRHPFMYAAAVPLGVTFYFCFNPPANMGQWGLFTWMLLSSILARTAMTLYHVPHLALGAELSHDYSERSVIVAFRTFFGYAGAAALFIVCYRVLMAPTEGYPDNGQLNPAAYPRMGWLFGAAMAVLILLSAWGTHSRIPQLPVPAAEPEPFGARRIWHELRQGLANRSFRALFVGLLFFFIARGVETGLGLYMGTYFWKLGTQAVAIPIAGLVGVMLGTIFWARMARRFEKKPTFLFGFVGFSTITMLMPVLKLLELWPEAQNPLYIRLIYLGTFLAAFIAAAALISAGSMLADIADEHELNTGRRQEGIFFGALSFSGKASSGIGTGLSGLALWAIDFPDKANPDLVDTATVAWLGIIYGPGTIVLILVATAMLMGYQLDRARHGEIQAELAARRS